MWLVWEQGIRWMPDMLASTLFPCPWHAILETVDGVSACLGADPQGLTTAVGMDVPVV